LVGVCRASRVGSRCCNVPGFPICSVGFATQDRQGVAPAEHHCSAKSTPPSIKKCPAHSSVVLSRAMRRGHRAGLHPTDWIRLLCFICQYHRNIAREFGSQARHAVTDTPAHDSISARPLFLGGADRSGPYRAFACEAEGRTNRSFWSGSPVVLVWWILPLPCC
jgi:hypothetical protein